MGGENPGSGVVEIAALTALVGVSTVESLVLGDRGAAGLPWAAQSSFGVIFMIQACIAASTPDRLRDTMGVRGERADLAVGLHLGFHMKRKRKIHGKTEGIAVHMNRIGKVCTHPDEGVRLTKCVQMSDDVLSAYPEDRMISAKREEVRIFDHYHQTLLQQCQIIPPDRPIVPYIYTQDLAFWQQKRRKRLTGDVVSFTISLFKFTEFLAMWYLDARLLASVGMVNWAFFGFPVLYYKS
jgi:hypothetical protein